jgi:MFS family permease
MGGGGLMNTSRYVTSKFLEFEIIVTFHNDLNSIIASGKSSYPLIYSPPYPGRSQDLVPLRQRGLVQGFANLCFGMGASLGGPLGGLVADTIGWRWAFILQVPPLMIAFIGVWLFLNYRVRSEVAAAGGKAKLTMIAKRIDWWGSGGLILSVG